MKNLTRIFDKIDIFIMPSQSKEPAGSTRGVKQDTESKVTLESIRTLLEEQLKPIRTELDEMKTSLDSATEKLNVITTVSAKVDNLEIKQNAVEQKLQKCERCKELEDKLLRVEIFSRKNNLKFLNINSDQRTNAPEDCEAIILDKCAGYGIQLEPRDLERAHRMGHSLKKNRPIIVKFSNFRDKMIVLKEKQRFQADGITIVEDFPIEIQARRRVFTPILKAVYSSGGQNMARLVSDKLLLNGKLYGVDDLDDLPEELKPTNLSTVSHGGITAFFTKYSALSNHHRCTFVAGGTTFSSVEQYLMFHKALKFNDIALSQKIMATDDPVEAKSLGKKVTNFNFQAWKEVRDRYMKSGLKAKFEQNIILRESLKATDDSVIVEANPADTYWGAGLSLNNQNIWDITKWKGQNKLGKLLSEVREEI